MAYAKTEQEWAERAARHLKSELKRADLTYDDLAERLKKHRFPRLRRVLPTSLHAQRYRLTFS